MKENAVDVIRTTAGEVAAELARRGIGSGERVTVTIDPAEEARSDRPTLADNAARKRASAVARGLTTEIFDALLARR